MLIPVKRSEIFRTSVFADNYIAEMQRAYARDYNLNSPKEAALLKKYYDHLKPFTTIEKPIDGEQVLAYPAKSKLEYEVNFPLVLKQFLQELGITEIYLLEDNRICITTEFPFQNFHKRNLFKRFGGKKSAAEGYRVTTNKLDKVFPLFFFSRRYDVPVIFLLTAKGKTEIAMRLCDDGNLHISYQKAVEQQIHQAASSAGLRIGDRELCDAHSVVYFFNGYINTQ